MSQEKSAGAVIFYKQGKRIEYLLLHYEAGHWDFPKGHIEKSESLEETVRREVREETGIKDIEFVPGFKEHMRYWFRKKKEWHLKKIARERVPSHREDSYREGSIFKIVTFYLGGSRTQDVTLSFEHIGYVWLPYDAAYEKLTFKNAKDILEKAKRFLEEKT